MPARKKSEVPVAILVEQVWSGVVAPTFDVRSCRSGGVAGDLVPMGEVDRFCGGGVGCDVAFAVMSSIYHGQARSYEKRGSRRPIGIGRGERYDSQRAKSVPGQASGLSKDRTQCSKWVFNPVILPNALSPVTNRCSLPSCRQQAACSASGVFTPCPTRMAVARSITLALNSTQIKSGWAKKLS